MTQQTPIEKSSGVTRTEQLLADLCERTFLRLWSYPNPFKDDGKELCDLLVVFENDVIIFFDRESRRFEKSNKDTIVSWNRWKKEAVDKQIATAHGAERYIKRGSKIFLDSKCNTEFPIPILPNARVHKVVVAHGAAEACAQFSDQNVYGSLAVSYGDDQFSMGFPFSIDLDKNDIVHVLDSENVTRIFSTLDTLFDFTTYLREKERAIKELDFLVYCGEEDLVAHYLLNYSEERNKYEIGFHDRDYNSLLIGEGEWSDFEKKPAFNRRVSANKVSYFWDEIIQRTCSNALDGTIQGQANLLTGPSALHEMAREPRFSRRAISEAMIEAINNFPESNDPIVRNLSFMPSFYEGVGYVFLQLKCINKGDYESEYRPKRQAFLEIACGAARNKFSHLKKVIGIAIDAPKYESRNSEDFALLICDKWTEEQAQKYREANHLIGFFESPNLQQTYRKVTDFPVPEKRTRRIKIGRNDPCPCGSGKKYKKCCLK